jgi:glycosyltransferase involved in cell wall biosynthesis
LGLFKAVDMVCVPSRNEPFGIVILEAWSARKPVVTTRNGGPAEFVRHEETGVTVAADHESIGEGIDVILSDRTYGRRLGRNGRREAESHFTWDVIAGQTEEVYRSVLQRRSE